MVYYMYVCKQSRVHPLWACGSIAHTLYVGMAQKQDGSSNQCLHGDIIAREQMLA